MTTRIEWYQVVEFKDHDERAEFSDALQRFVMTPEGLKHLAANPVLWISDSDISRGENRLYLSAGAVVAAAEVGIPFRIAREIAVEELPEDKALLIGDQSVRE